MTVRTQLLTLGLLMLLIGIWDFAGRVYVGRDASLRAFHAPTPSRLPPEESSDTIRRRMLGWLPAIAGSVHEPPNLADPMAWRFALVGLFAQRGQAIAVVASSHQGGGAAERLRVVEGDTIHGWTVTRVDAHGVTLTRDAETRQLVLFKRGQRQPAGAGAAPH